MEIKIREICGEWALDIEMPYRIQVIYFTSRQNALNVKRLLETVDRIIEVDNSKPNCATVCDMQEVVRCKDCKYSRPKNKSEKNIYFEDVIICESCEMADEPCAVLTNDFCSYGERKDGADND